MKTMIGKGVITIFLVAILVILVLMFLFFPNQKILLENRTSYLMSSSMNMYTKIGCWPTSIKSLNDRFYQMEPASNSCNKKIPAAFTEVYYPTQKHVLHGLKKFARDKTKPIQVSIGSSPLDKKSFGIIISNLNKHAMKTLESTFLKSDPVPVNGGSLFLAFKHYDFNGLY